MDFSSLKDRIVWFSLPGLISWMVFLSYGVMHAATDKEVRDIVQSESPYSQDRLLIMKRLDDLSSLTESIQAHTKEIHGLRVQIERLLVQQGAMYEKLEDLESRLDEGQ